MRLFVVALALASCAPPTSKNPSQRFGFTPRWAYQPWISKDISTAADTYDFVAGFEQRDIPVGVVVLDSPWETNYNTFIPNPSRYPEFESMVANLRARRVRTVLWITQMLNETSFDLEAGGDVYRTPADGYAEAKRRGYFVNDGQVFDWWKGFGGAIDFFNEEAKSFWHAKQERVLKVIDGYKCDFGDEYIRSSGQKEIPSTELLVKTQQGEKTLQAYSEAYYRDYLENGRRVRGDEFLTMVRPYDRSYGFPGRFYARKEHCPICWVGDNRRDWVGLADALDHIFRSAKAGYVAVSSDLGGYLDVDDIDLLGLRIPFNQSNFARWTAVSALTPFMQLHGRGNFAPWTVPERPDETVALYRYWSKLHAQLVPYFYSVGEAAYRGEGEVPIRPVGELETWPGDYRFFVGDSLLVAPILDDSGRRDVPLPVGARFFSWWDETGAPVNGGQTLQSLDFTDRSKIPLFVKEGALLVADVVDGSTRLGTPAHAGMLTLLAWPSPSPTSFTVFEDATSYVITSRVGEVRFESMKQGAMLELWMESPPASMSVNGRALNGVASKAEVEQSSEAYFVVPESRFVWVKIAAQETGAVTVAWSP
jgi:alpha-glucosidase (family GH31 glycosyl hydrolase)